MPLSIDGSSSTTKTDLRVGKMSLYLRVQWVRPFCTPSRDLHIGLMCNGELRAPLGNALSAEITAGIKHTEPLRVRNQFGKGITCIFSITWWRCAFTVRSVVPSSWAICLLILPRTIRLKTCRSRASGSRQAREGNRVRSADGARTRSAPWRARSRRSGVLTMPAWSGNPRHPP